MIDLHLHSTCSDGSQTPEELADEAARRGLAAAALTDHESMAGTSRFEAAAAGRFRAVPGVEVSAALTMRLVSAHSWCHFTSAKGRQAPMSAKMRQPSWLISESRVWVPKDSAVTPLRPLSVNPSMRTCCATSPATSARWVFSRS